jgi:hypothetical protein
VFFVFFTDPLRVCPVPEFSRKGIVLDFPGTCPPRNDQAASSVHHKGYNRTIWVSGYPLNPTKDQVLPPREIGFDQVPRQRKNNSGYLV